MSIAVPPWETALLTLAAGPAHPSDTLDEEYIAEEARLDRAFDHCRLLTANHSKSFYLASRLLPFQKRRAVWALYAFCRTCDDIVDSSAVCPSITDAEARLEKWRALSLSQAPPAHEQVALAWAATRWKYSIPACYAEQLIDGVAMDFSISRYATFTDLAFYAYRVASTVGLMSMHIIGYSGNHAIPYAIKLGVAMQITNILRDIGEDWEHGRLYLPEDELDMFNITEEDIAAGKVDDRWRRFMQFQIDRNQRLYDESLPGIQLLKPDGRRSILAASMFYRSILDDIQAHDYDVFTRRAHVSNFKKLSLVPGIWFDRVNSMDCI